MNIFACNIKKSQNPELLYIITVYFNPSKSEFRARLHREFHQRLQGHAHVRLVTIECAFSEDPFEMTRPNARPLEIQIRSLSPFWVKENLINIALKVLSKDKCFLRDCKYVAWVDADIEFMDVEWYEKLKASLRKYSIVQMFKYALFLDKDEKPIEMHTSFGYYYATRNLKLRKGEYPHPGYAWCTTRANMLKMKEVFDQGVLGSGDTHMAFALVGEYERGFLTEFEYEGDFKASVRKWQEKALKVFQGNLGFVDMGIRHFWHGSRQSRQQIHRWRLLQDFRFNPVTDLIKAKDGHYELTGNKKGLEASFLRVLERMKEEEGFEEPAIPEERTAVSLINFPINFKKPLLISKNP